MDEFEQFLSKQSVRSIPSEWRRKFLVGAPAHQPWWREWLWPSPVAWAALGCAWLMIIALNLATHSSRAVEARQQSAAVNIVAALAEQRRLLAELTSQPATEPVRRRGETGPRSDLRPEFVET